MAHVIAVVNNIQLVKMSMDHIHSKNSKLNYNYITDGIYIGNNQCCIIGLNEVLKNEDIVADISLEEISIDQPYGVEAYLWLPTPDHTPPTQDQLLLGATTLANLVKQNKKVYVHCKNGHGRASTLVAAYLIAQGHSKDEAELIIKKGRPSIHLQDSQREALEKFATTFSKT